MRALLDPDLEALIDRMVVVAIGAMLVIGLVGSFLVDGYVGLQANEDGFTTRVPPLAAALIFPFAAYVARAATTRSAAPWVRWLGRSVILFLFFFEILAFMNTS